MNNLPDADVLMAALVAKLKPIVTTETGMIGIVTGGAWLAERLHRDLGLKVPLGRLDISFYRDDFSSSGLHASVKPSQVPFSVDDREILLVDDEADFIDLLKIRLEASGYEVETSNNGHDALDRLKSRRKSHIGRA